MNRTRFLNFLLTVQLAALAAFAFARDARGAEKFPCDSAGEARQVLVIPESAAKVFGEGESAIPTDWEGTYDGGNQEAVIRRTMEMHLDPVGDAEGDVAVTGTINIRPYVGDIYSVYEGAYKFAGTYNKETGKIVVQGQTWVSFPIDQNTLEEAPDWDFFVFTGTVSADKITGTTVRGNWRMFPQSYDGDDVDSGFGLERDNNSFVHGNRSPEDGFYGSTNYVISSELFERLKSFASSESEVNVIKQQMNVKWSGSCYGISVTMGLTFEKLLDAGEISGESLSPDDYYNMPQPKDCPKLKDIINYYHLSQDLENYGEYAGRSKNFNPSLWNGWIYGYEPKFMNESLSGFLGNLVKDTKAACEDGKPLLFCFGVPNLAHLVLVTGYSVSEDGYRLKMYDMNSVREYKGSGRFTYMSISKDLTTFSFMTGNGEIVDEDNYLNLSYLEPSKLSDIKYCSLGKRRSSDQVTIAFSPDSEFTLTGPRGATLTYRKSAFSGSFPINSVDYLEKKIKIKTKRFENFTIAPLGKEINIQVYDDDHYKSVEGKNIKKIDLSLTGDTKLTGGAYTFKAYSSVEEKLGKGESGLASISGKANGKVIIRSGKDKVEASSPKKISHVKTAVYQDVRTAGGTIKGRRTSVSVNAAEDLSNRDLNVSGRIVFGKDAYVYRGWAVKPKVTVFAGGRALRKNKDYKISYSDNKKIGTGTVTVTGLGEYKGEISATFPIVPKK